MRKFLFVSLLAIGLGTSFAVTAQAATELGSRCAPYGSEQGAAAVGYSSNFMAPSKGVITRWGANVLALAPDPAILFVVADSGPTWTVMGTSDRVFYPADAAYEFPARIRISAGDRIGSAGIVGYCTAPAGQNLGKVVTYPLLPSNGQMLTLETATEVQPSVWATVEPDADDDGYGDETQDQCPQGAKLQVACPTPVLSAFRISSSKSFQALVTTDFITTVSAVGTVKLPAKKGKKAKSVTFASKPITTVPGTQQKLTLKYPSKLKNALAQLSRKKSLKLSVTFTAAGLFQNGTKTLTAKLKGKRK